MKKLRPQRFNSKIDREVTEVDYWGKLSQEEKAFMNDFNSQLRDGKSVGICPMSEKMRREVITERRKRKSDVANVDSKTIAAHHTNRKRKSRYSPEDYDWFWPEWMDHEQMLEDKD